MTSRVRIRLRPATAGRIIFFLILYLMGLSLLPGLVPGRQSAAEAATCAPFGGAGAPCPAVGMVRS
jgi:hypothetical protein